MELAIIPHWDNAEGGTHDTRACFMGMERFARLQAQLPPTAVVLGVDEHTAVTLDLEGGAAVVRGKGGVSVLRGRETLRFVSGDPFPLDVLRSGKPTPKRHESESGPAAKGHEADAIGQAAARIGAGDLAAGLRLAAAEAPKDLAPLLHQAAAAAEPADSGDELGPLLELLIEIRAGLRERGEWALADGLRDRLLAIGFELRDTAQGTVWVRVT
jgi:hypothetical protein